MPSANPWPSPPPPPVQAPPPGTWPTPAPSAPGAPVNPAPNPPAWGSPPAPPAPPAPPPWAPPAGPPVGPPAGPPYAAPGGPPGAPPTYGGWYGATPSGPPQWSPPAEPPPRRSRRLVVLLGLLVVVLVGATAAVFLVERDDGPHYPKAWDSRILPIVQFDEHERGLQFKHPVEVMFMAPKAFDKLVTTSSSSLSAKDKAQLQDEAASLRALGLIDGSVDLFKQENDLNSGGILAYYDPHDKKVRVKGSDLTPDVRVTLAHELTHALQDQYFDLGREDKLPDDAEQAFRSVVEGDAVVVQDAYADTMSKADQEAYDKAESDGSSVYTKIPDILVAQQLEPYVVGPAFVTALKEHGGDEAIDEAIRHPPASTAALMDIFRYLEQPAVPTGSTTTTMAVPKLASGDKKVDSGDFGALYWYLMLARRLDVHQAMKAVDGWAADSSLTYREPGGRVCVDAAYRGQSGGDADTMAQLLQQWKDAGPDTGVTIRTDGDVVNFTSCDPGKSVKLRGTDRSSDAVAYAATRVAIVGELFKQNVPVSVAQCAVDGMFRKVSFSDVVGIDNGTADAAVTQKAREALITSLANCH